MKKWCALTSVLLFVIGQVWSQTTISGKVVSVESGNPVDGANIRVDHSLAGCSTNAKGEFILRNLPEGTHELRVTHVSYAPRSVTVKSGESQVVVQLENSYINIGQVVVTGTGTHRRMKDSPVPVSVITAQDIREANLSTMEEFSYGNMKSWDAEGRQFQFNAARPKNLLDIALKRWTPENPTNDYPKIRLNGTNYGMTDFWLHDASYLKINNISLTYQLPAKWLRRTGFVDRAELFGSITNVYTFTSYPGPNPESFNRADKIAGAAVDYTAYPQTRTYNIGIKLSVK